MFGSSSASLISLFSATRKAESPEDSSLVEEGKASLEETDNENLDDPATMSIITKHVPALTTEPCTYRPPFGLSQGDVQTLFTVLNSMPVPGCFDTITITALDGGTLALDFYAAPWLKADSPIVIIFPGITGSSTDFHVKNTACDLSRLVNGSAYRVVVANPRGVTQPLTSPRLTHAGSTEDVRRVVSFLQAAFPECGALFGVGFSLGGGLLSNYLAEEGTDCPLTAGFCVSTVWDLQACSARIEDESILRRIIYSYGIGSKLTSIVRDNEAIFREAGSAGLGTLLAHKKNSMSTFNEAFMAHLACYENTSDFAAATSPIFKVQRVTRPCIFLNALDDPFCGEKCLDPVKKKIIESGNDNLVLALATKGGHVSWLQKNKEGNLDCWFTRPVREFFDSFTLQ